MLKTFQVSFLILFFFSRTFAQDLVGHYAIGIQGGLNLPIGKSIVTQLPEKMGAAYGFTFKYFPSERFSMGFNLRSINSNITTTSPFTVPSSHTIISLSAEHYFNSEGSLRPFMGLELGITVNNFDFPVPFKNLQLVPNPYSSFLIAPKVGISYQLNDSWSVVGEAVFHKLYDPGDTSSWKADDGTAFAPVRNFLSGSIGITFHFGDMAPLKPQGKGIHKHTHEH